MIIFRKTCTYHVYHSRLTFILDLKDKASCFFIFVKIKFLKTLCMRDHFEFDFRSTATDIEILLFLVGCSVIAMSCYTSYSNELRDQTIKILQQSISIGSRQSDCLSSYGWTCGFGWASAGIALVGTVISSIGLFMSQNDTGNPTMTFKSWQSFYQNIWSLFLILTL